MINILYSVYIKYIHTFLAYRGYSVVILAVDEKLTMEQDIKARIDDACRTAEEFTKLYYEKLDKQRYLISKLYLDTGILIWNGNGKEGKDEIQKFWMGLPPSDHTITTLDAQPIIGSVVANQLTFLVKVNGQVKYQDKTSRPFNQNFLITAAGDKWKIVSDCFRTQEALDSST